MTHFGAVQKVVVCVPSVEPPNAQQQAICPSVDGVPSTPTLLEAYLIDPSQQDVIQASVGPFDYGQAAGLWFAAFSMVVGLYFVSTAIGAILGLIRR